MLKILSRIMVVLLVLCLVVDPSVAGTMFSQSSYIGRSVLIQSEHNRFREEAFAVCALEMLQGYSLRWTAWLFELETRLQGPRLAWATLPASGASPKDP